MQPQQDPKAAAAQLPQLPLAQQEATAGHIARSLARSSPEEAARWAAQLPEDSNVRGHAYGQVLADWVEGDPFRASEWLQKLPQSQSRDAAVSTFATRLRDTDPDSAAVWAGSIANEGQRNASLDSVLDHWLKTDPASARRWVASSPNVSDEARTRYLGQP